MRLGDDNACAMGDQEMPDKPKISIIIIVHNRKHYCRIAIESAINQTYQNKEVIIVDTGSTDGSVEVIKEYQTKANTIFLGPAWTAKAINKGIENSTGEYILVLHDDNVLYPNALELLTAPLDKISTPKIIPYTSYDVVDKDGKVVTETIEPDFNKLPLKIQKVINFYYGHACYNASLISRKIIDEFGAFREDLQTSEDSEIWLRYCVIHDCILYRVEGKALQFRMHEGTLTHNTFELGNQIVRKLKEETLLALPKEEADYIKKNKKLATNYVIPKSVQVRRRLRDSALSLFPKNVRNHLINRYLKYRGIIKYEEGHYGKI